MGNPDDFKSQTELTAGILKLCREYHLTEEHNDEIYERVFSKKVANGIRVKIYTSIEEGSVVRDVGRDAIRICCVRNCADGRTRGLIKEKRVNRVGKISAILKRIRQRIATVIEKVDDIKTCWKCGAPKFCSKKGNWVCSDICWVN